MRRIIAGVLVVLVTGLLVLVTGCGSAAVQPAGQSSSQSGCAVPVCTSATPYTSPPLSASQQQFVSDMRSNFNWGANVADSDLISFGEDVVCGARQGGMAQSEVIGNAVSSFNNTSQSDATQMVRLAEKDLCSKYLPSLPHYTVSEQQAIDAAKSYLSMGGFSRAGLIDQLHSSYGDGFSLADATFAVDHVTVNWDHQAVLAAKGYLSLGGFSCSSLVQQLDSSYGDKFTQAQAEYAAKAVGLC